MSEFIFGKLTLQALPHETFMIGGALSLTLGGLFLAAALTYFKKWKWLWTQWLTSTDPKKIGVMYIIVAALMLLRGGLDAIMIWLQQAMSSGASHGYLSSEHFQQIFTAHGDIMVFFVAMGLLSGLINLMVPLQIGARDVAYPFINTLSFWLFTAGAILMNLFFIFGGEFAATGWLALSPLSELQYSPGVGVDYWIWSLQISGLGTLLSGINFIVTILKMRAPGMTLMRMPMFIWTSLCSSILIISIFPILSLTLILLYLDRYFGMHFFTTDGGGNAMMYVNLIWSWGHPEVYVIILPAFGIFSEVVSTFAKKHLYSYKTGVAAAFGVLVLSMLVWLHHFFTMGAGANVNAFFGIMTTLIAIPTGVQFFNWLLTLYKGRVTLSLPMYWFLAFAVTFTLGGMAGVLMAIPPLDFQIHNSLFLVAHFHTMVIGGAVFGIFAGLSYWFPKITGLKLNEKYGKISFWLWLIGFLVAFIPLYILGMLGATRRLDHYDASLGWQGLFVVALIGGLMIGAAVLAQIWQVVVSYKEKIRDVSGDPFDGRTLEWSTASPPPIYNFAVIPTVTDRDTFWASKQSNTQNLTPKTYSDIHMPKNTAAGIYVSLFCFLAGFAFVWHIAWLQVVGILGAIIVVIHKSLEEESEYTIPAAEVERMEKERISFYEPMSKISNS